MLKDKEQWTSLPVEERLFLLAMSFNLPNICGIKISLWEVMENTGFNLNKIYQLTQTLEEKNLVLKICGREMGQIYFQFKGDAVSSSLCRNKLPNFPRE